MDYGVSFDPHNYPGSNWVHVSVGHGLSVDFCEECSTPIRELLPKLMKGT